MEGQNQVERPLTFHFASNGLTNQQLLTHILTLFVLLQLFFMNIIIWTHNSSIGRWNSTFSFDQNL